MQVKINQLLLDCTAILIRLYIKTLRFTSSVKKFPLYTSLSSSTNNLTSTVAFLAVKDEGLTLTLIFLSFVSPSFVMKNLGSGNLSAIMY